MDNKRFFRVLTPEVGLYFWIILILLIIIAFYNPWVALIGLPIFCYLLYYNAKSKYRTTREITKYIENLTFHVDTATKDTLLHFPLPMVVLQLDGTIIWYNSGFSDICGDENLFEKPIQLVIEDLKVNKLIENQKDNRIFTSIFFRSRYYNVLGNVVNIDSISDNSYIIVLYWIDNTNLKAIEKKYLEEKSIESIITIDNFDEVMQSTDDENKPQVLAEIDRRLARWVLPTNGILKKIEKDKYIFIFDNQYLKKFEERKFEILDQIREINVGNKIPVTLSIGIGMNGENLLQNDMYAKAAIDVALGRGGDQVVIKDGNDLRFFGGKTKELEKRTKVKARVVAYALRELIAQAEQVIIMGHQYADVDAVGAAIGLYSGVRSKGKNCYIILNSYNTTVERLLSRLKQEGEYDNTFITRNQALAIVNERTLVIIVDAHRASFTECPELIERTNRIVIIDHHRRGAEFIENAVLVYHEPYASSACEMVTEILQYLGEKVKLTTAEAEALYAGITVDTKNFTFKTGVRTFEAASFLRRIGVDTISVKQLFQNDLETFLVKAAIVKAAEVYNGEIAISAARENIKNAQMVIAQAADELLNISGITASFVMCRADNEVFISGRSLGDMNVQVVLEKLGGGGHLTVAGAQLSDISIDEAQQKLKQAIEEYFSEMNDKK